MNVKLLRKVKKHILEEPKRLNMYEGLIADSSVPCGTAGCIAGWACVLDARISVPKAGFEPWGTISRQAKDALGLADDQAFRLFRSWMWPDKFASDFDEADKATQAKVTAARIDHFIKTNGEE